MESHPRNSRHRCWTLVLLLCLFVPEAAVADCPIPPVKFDGYEGVIATDETLVMSDFPEGGKITVECSHGHTQDGGSGTVTCVNGQWGVPDMVCKLKDCGPPKPQPHMKFNISLGTLFGARIKVTCDEGYRIQGVSYMECYPTGWKGRSSCHIATCSLPVVVANASVSWTSSEKPQYGDVVEYTCNDGYVAVGQTSLRCTATGKYDDQPPVCEDAFTVSEHHTTTVEQTTALTPDTSTTAAPTTAASTTVAPTTVASTTAASTTAYRDESLTSPATPRRGNRGAEEQMEAAVTSAPSTPSTIFGGSVLVVIVVAVVLLLIGVAAGIVLYKFLLRRKGSYDTREDLKPELLSFQNV